MALIILGRCGTYLFQGTSGRHGGTGQPLNQMLARKDRFTMQIIDKVTGKALGTFFSHAH